MTRRYVLAPLFFATWSALSSAQTQTEPTILGDAIIDPAIRHSLLPYAAAPFHTVLDISHPGDTDHSGKVEIWWVDPTHYALDLTSPNFTQHKVVSGDQVQETNTGTFLPRWLETFERALLNPVPDILRGHGLATRQPAPAPSGFSTAPCASRDDRPGGITDPMTWGRICLDETGTRVSSILAFCGYLSLANWQPFGKQEIARQYETRIHDDHPVKAQMTKLESLAASDRAHLNITSSTSPQAQLTTTFISTAKAESLLGPPPAIQWPPVNEGKTEGYMIVYIRTDPTGQVREAYPHTSDNAGLEDFGADQALRYKFKPLVVDGVPTQIEAPLVLHFASTLKDPTPVLSVSEMKQQTIRCHPDPVPVGVLTKDQHAIVQVSVDATGAVLQAQPASKAPWGQLVGPWMSVKRCTFRPYMVNGQPTYYKGDVELPR